MNIDQIPKKYNQDINTKPVVSATFIITGQCSLRCKYCFEHDMATEKRKPMSSDIAIESLNYLYENNFSRRPLG